MDANRMIATILRHDRKNTSYKIALIRSINDLVLGYPHLARQGSSVAIPLRRLASFWISYYWAFVSQKDPIRQGQLIKDKYDISFRPALSKLRLEWEKLMGESRPSDGYFLESELGSAYHLRTYSDTLIQAHAQTILAISDAMLQPIRYAGPEEYGVFPRPQKWKNLQSNGKLVCMPETKDEDVCVVIEGDIWSGFGDLSLWIEALCIHEWCQFTHNLLEIDPGNIYRLLTDRPDNRRPLTWERNNVEILMMEGRQFICPWTGKNLHQANYDIDHLLPISIYPINELWNLAPSDRYFNQHNKRDRVPGKERLVAAQPRLIETYKHYLSSDSLKSVLLKDSRSRFVQPTQSQEIAVALAGSVIQYLETITYSRNLASF